MSRVDAAEARECGRQVVICATEADVDGSIVMRRAGGRRYAVEYDRTELSNVARHTKSLPDEFVAPEGNDVTQAFVDYAEPLVGRLPAVEDGTTRSLPLFSRRGQARPREGEEGGKWGGASQSPFYIGRPKARWT